MSEHAFGNALDVMAFVLADGREITVVKGWRGDPAEQEFLREAFVGACRYFNTVWDPGPTRSTHDHLHLDLARHNPRGDRRVCSRCIKFEPRIDPVQSRLAAPLSPSADLPPSIWKTTSKALNQGAASMSRVDQGKQGARASPPTFQP